MASFKKILYPANAEWMLAKALALEDVRPFAMALRCVWVCVVSIVCSSLAHADDEGQFYGPLRARDLTPFGSLRLDLRPAHAVAIERSSFAIEADLAYQNTWALSPEVERYLTEREVHGRQELTIADAQAIRDLPGENYLLDLESAAIDVTVHYKFADNMSAYLSVSAISYDGGFLDSTIESFHDTFGFSSFGRPAASRNDVNLIYDLKSAQVELFDAPTSGGLTDPTLGVRYTGIALSEHWRMGFEGAMKIPVAGRRDWLSTGRSDYGVQVSLQRRGNRHAVYADLAAVYYAGALEPAPQEAQIIPTIILGHEYRWTQRTNTVLQAYVSKSAYTSNTTDLDELNGAKYQLTLGLRHMRGNFLFTFGVTENFQNVNNTPDVGFQIGLAFIPQLIRQPHRVTDIRDAPIDPSVDASTTSRRCATELAASKCGASPPIWRAHPSQSVPVNHGSPCICYCLAGARTLLPPGYACDSRHAVLSSTAIGG